MNLSEKFRPIEEKEWILFYRKQAGLVTDEEFAREMRWPLDKGKELDELMWTAANPYLIESVRYYFCTDMRDRDKSHELLIKASTEGDPIAKYVLTERNGKW